MSDAEVVDWFFGVMCAKCKKPILIFDDKSKAEAPIEFAGDGKLHVVCPRSDCHHDQEYGTGELQRFRVSRKA